MADDQFQRPYRASEPPVRGAAKTPGSDPLAELARLIGQTDPFAEFGRESARRAPAPQPGEGSDWNTQPTGTPYRAQAEADARTPIPPQRLGNGYYASRSVPAEQQADAAASSYGGQNYGRQSYAATPPPTDDGLYEADHEARGYAPSQADFPHDPYEQETAQHVEEEYYDDVPSSRRRLGVMAIAGVFALAVIGTAGAYGYRALFGSSGSTQPPPVIRADAGPSKIVPATSGKDTQSNKLITDRLNERGQSEKLVSREEQPIDKPATVALSQSAPQPTLGSGVVGNEAKKIRTIAIHPDQPVAADATPPSASTLAPAAPAARAAPPPPPTKPAAPPARIADSATADAEEDATSPPAARSAPPVRQTAPAAGNAPLSLNPNAPPARAATRAPAAAPAAPTRTASVAPAPQAIAPAVSAGAGGSGSYVQVSSQRSEAEAQAAFRSLQAKFPNQLGGRQPQIHKADLGAKGTYYRAMVGPFANANEAGELCSSLKAAGGQCLVQRN
jgi:sporulation related protein